MATLNTAEKSLILVLRITAVSLLLALVPAVMPFHWMEIVHDRLGLGKLPDALIVQYLTRSCSLMYAMHGAIILFVSFHIHRYRPFVLFQGWLSMIFGAAMLMLDVAIGMPLPWILGEGPFIILLGILIVYLCSNMAKESVGTNYNRV